MFNYSTSTSDYANKRIMIQEMNKMNEITTSPLVGPVKRQTVVSESCNFVGPHVTINMSQQCFQVCASSQAGLPRLNAEKTKKTYRRLCCMCELTAAFLFHS